MAVCNDKACEAIVCGDCKDLIPSMCGDRVPNIVEGSCSVIHFEGVDDMSINQGECIDLTEGVHAYDGNGNEIEYTVTPSEIPCCGVGEYEVKYSAVGIGNKMLPSFCTNAFMLMLSDCGMDTKSVLRKIIVNAIVSPIISGIDTACIDKDTLFNPMSGVSAVDGNGNTLEVDHNGIYDQVASGSIASFESVGGNIKSLIASIEPVQDLNGYDKPWSGGNGKNKVDITSATVSTQTILYSISLKAGTYTLSAICTNNTSISGYLSIRLNGVAKGTITIASGDSGARKSATFTISEDASYDVVGSGASSGYNFTVSNVQLEIGSAMTDFAPYSNICPISGHDSVVVTRTGINVWDEEWEVGGLSHGAPVTNASRIQSKNYIVCKPNTTYYFNKGVNNGNMWASFYDINKEYINVTGSGNGVNVGGSNSAYTTPDNCYYMKFFLSAQTEYQYDVAINYPSTDTEYHAYDGHIYTTDLGRTVYGGSLDVVSGVLTVDRAMVDLGTLNWGYNSAQNFFFATLQDMDSADSATDNLICDSYVYVRKSWASMENGEFGKVANSKQIRFHNDAYTTASDFKTAMNGVQVVYELATPQTYQLTPQQVTALLGDNNVWADTGDVVVTYPIEMPDGAFTFPTDGAYEITYHAEDECGNETTETRLIVVGSENSVCKARVCCASTEEC